MREVEIINAGKEEIIYLDFSNLKSKEQIFTQIEVFGSFIKKQRPRSVHTITNLEGMHFNTEIYNAFIAYVNGNSPYVKESVVIGLKGLMQIFYKGFIKLTGRNVQVCSTREEAIALLSQRFATAV